MVTAGGTKSFMPYEASPIEPARERGDGVPAESDSLAKEKGGAARSAALRGKARFRGRK